MYSIRTIFFEKTENTRLIFEMKYVYPFTLKSRIGVFSAFSPTVEMAP